MKILIVGCGSIGCRHAKNFHIQSSTEVVLFDKHIESAIDLADALEAMVVSNLDDPCLSGIDAVVVATPSHTHFEVAARFASTNIQILVEKPIASNVPDALRLIEMFGDRLHVVSNMRYHQAIDGIRTALPKIGRPLIARSHFGSYLPEMRPNSDYRNLYVADRSKGGGVVTDCIHEFDYLVHLFGEANSVQSKAEKISDLEILSEDYAHICITHANGLRSEVHLDYLQRSKQRGCEVIGTEGTISWRSVGKNPEICNLQLYTNQDGWQDLLSAQELSANDSYVMMAQDFCGIVSGKPRIHLSTGPEGLAALKVVSSALEDAEIYTI